MATIDDVYNKLLELEKEVQKLKKSQKVTEENLAKRISVMGTEVSRLRSAIK